ncbi:MAG: hypothetical protein Q9162_002434 [Coniocarpon cinnabarinum]
MSSEDGVGSSESDDGPPHQDAAFPAIDHKDFRAAIAHHYGIKIRKRPQIASPFEHFDTSDPKCTDPYQEDVVSLYEQNHPHCHFWHAIDNGEASEQARQYRCLARFCENQAKFSHYSRIFFVKEDEVPSEYDVKLMSKAYVKYELSIAPNIDVFGHHYDLPPPMIHTKDRVHIYNATFDFNPTIDCTYWLVAHRLEVPFPKMRAYFGSDGRYLAGNLIFPYFMIQFKDERADIAVAENQIALAAALTTYARFQLRCQQLACRDQYPLTPRDFTDIGIYAAVFDGSRVNLYEIQPIVLLENCNPKEDLAEFWGGCSVTHFCTHDLTSTESTLMVRRWFNEIHNWGLGPYSDGIALDVNKIMDQGGREESV